MTTSLLGEKYAHDNGASRIQPPPQFAPTGRHQDTEAIDEEIIPMILPEQLNLARLLANREAVQK